MMYRDYLIPVVVQLLTLIPSSRVARQYRPVWIGQPTGAGSCGHDARIRFFNLANALRGEIATRRSATMWHRNYGSRRYDIVHHSFATLAVSLAGVWRSSL